MKTFKNDEAFIKFLSKIKRSDKFGSKLYNMTQFLGDLTNESEGKLPEAERESCSTRAEQ